ncbi:hypothetical protein LUR56_30275 [Streptomyces sp. MT29]|nr:hypothetical protein [Streptomyces sp. MT29]
MTARLATLAVPVVGGIVVLSSVFSWSRSKLAAPFPAVWEDGSAFGASGTVPVAGALLALALGTLAGLLPRRTVPALVTALLASGLVTAVLALVRDHLWPMVKVTFPLGGDFPAPQVGPHRRAGLRDGRGRPVPGPDLRRRLPRLRGLPGRT